MMEVAYVRHKSERLEQIEKIANEPFSILDMKCPSEEACLLAVRADWGVFEYLPIQTEEICMEAVRQRGELLAYVEEQTLPVCRAAVMQNPDAMRLVDEWFKEDL